MRICLFTPTFLPKMGGQEMVVDYLARQYLAQGHEVVVLAQHASRSGTLAEANVPYPLKRFAKPLSQVWGIPSTRRALSRLHQSSPFDIVHSHSCYPTGFAALPFCQEFKIPLVVTSHGGDLADDSRFRARPVIMKRSRETLEGANAVTFISSYMRKMILEIAPDCEPRLVGIPNGVDCAMLRERISPAPSFVAHHGLMANAFFLFLGRLHRRKGVDNLIKAFCLTAAKNPELRLAIAGSGDEMAALQAQANATNYSARIHLLGAMQGGEKLWLLQNALCLVLPTRTRETFGLVLLESMACGKPVIATRTGGVLNLVEENQNGLLVGLDDPEGLAAAMDKIAGTPAIRERMVLLCLTTAEAFDWPAVAGKYLALFEKLLGKTRS
ncbi:MAG: glycosyltransferase family 4 protein [Verrucomicrobiota bacterium]